MYIKEDKIFIELSYTPAAQKLKNKFGTLPIRYMRVKIDNAEEFKVLEKVVKRYRFNLIDEDVDNRQKIEAAAAFPTKRKFIAPAPTFPTYSFEEDAEGINLVEMDAGEEETESSAGPSTSGVVNKKQKNK